MTSVISRGDGEQNKGFQDLMPAMPASVLSPFVIAFCTAHAFHGVLTLVCDFIICYFITATFWAFFHDNSLPRFFIKILSLWT